MRKKPALCLVAGAGAASTWASCLPVQRERGFVDFFLGNALGKPINQKRGSCLFCVRLRLTRLERGRERGASHSN